MEGTIDLYPRRRGAPVSAYPVAQGDSGLSPARREPSGSAALTAGTLLCTSTAQKMGMPAEPAGTRDSIDEETSKNLFDMVPGES
jgi:hypothetical protein